MGDPAQPQSNSIDLRVLRTLVMILMVVMIVGFLVVVVTLVISLSGRSVALPDSVTLPNGAKVEAFTVGDGWFAVVTDDSHILILDQSSGDIRQVVKIK